MTSEVDKRIFTASNFVAEYNVFIQYPPLKIATVLLFIQVATMVTP